MLPTLKENQDPRVRRTHESIVQAFTELLSRKGFQGISVQDIAQEAGINRATFYAHFPDKYALQQRFTEEEFRQEVEKRMLHACEFSSHNLHELITAVCEFVGNAHERCPATEAHFQSLVERQVRAQVQGLLNKWVEKMPVLGGSTISSERAATAAGWAVYGLATEWSNGRKQPPADQYANEVMPVVAGILGLTVELPGSG
jgi:AcrR family transcriptional regulator